MYIAKTCILYEKMTTLGPPFTCALLYWCLPKIIFYTYTHKVHFFFSEHVFGNHTHLKKEIGQHFRFQIHTGRYKTFTFCNVIMKRVLHCVFLSIKLRAI